MLTPQQLDNLQLAAIAAVKSEKQTGCPSDLTICQWALESGWGLRIPQASNNPFGIKALPGEPHIDLPTREVVNGVEETVIQPFRTFPTLEDAFTHHGLLISTGKPYASAFEQFKDDGDVNELIRGVARHYASDPHYAATLLKIGNMQEVQDALTKAEQA